MASWTERAGENGPHMPSANVWCEGYEILISLPNSFLLVRVVWEEGPENRWNHCNLLLAPSAFLSSPLVLSHSFNRCLSPCPQFIYSLAPPSISSFFFSFLHTLLLLFNKIITLHVQGTSISSEHVLSSSTLSFPLLSLPSQRWAEPMLFQIIQLLKLILS